MPQTDARRTDSDDDLAGRMIRAQQRAQMIGNTLEAMATTPLQDPDRDSLLALGEIARELAGEIAAIEAARLTDARAIAGLSA